MQVRYRTNSTALGLSLGGLFLIAMTSCARAGESAQRYQFEVLNQPVPVGAHTELTVKLTDAATGQPVQGATVVGGGLEMTHMHPPHKASPPGGMTTTMQGDVKFVGSSGPGLYQLMSDVSMPGKWKLDLSANIPGDPEPVQETVTFQAGR